MFLFLLTGNKYDDDDDDLPRHLHVHGESRSGRQKKILSVGNVVGLTGH